MLPSALAGLVLTLIMALRLPAQEAPAPHDKLLGKWTTTWKGQRQDLEFVKNGSSYEGIVRYAEDASLIGKKQVTGLKPAGKTSFSGGSFYVFKKGANSDCSIKLIDDRTLEMVVSYGLLSQKQRWTRL
jgi:hypothetical protein